MNANSIYDEFVSRNGADQRQHEELTGIAREKTRLKIVEAGRQDYLQS
jgi:hypothetical protein